MIFRSTVLGLTLFAQSSFAEIECPEILTWDGTLMSPTREEMPQQYFLGLDGNDISHQIIEDKKQTIYRNLDDISLNCLQSGNRHPSTRLVYEPSKIVIYAVYQDKVDYVIISPRKGPDDIVHHQGTRKEHLQREDAHIFKKRSMFEDLQQLIEAKISRN